MNNTVTVLIPTYKRPVKLKRAIESVLAQTYTDLKVIVCDNASRDETADVVHTIMLHDSRVGYFQHPENVGMNANFNFAVSKVETPFFCMLTDDDIYEQHFLTTALGLFVQYPTALAAVCNAPTRKDGLIISSQLATWKEGFYPPGSALNYCMNGKHPILTNCLFRKEVAAIFYFEPRLSCAGDIYFFVKLFSDYPSVISRVVTGYYDLHSSNETLKSVGREGLRQSIILGKMVNGYLKERGNNGGEVFAFPKWYIALASLIYYATSPRELQLAANDDEICGHFGLVFRLVVRLLGVPIFFVLAKGLVRTLKYTKFYFKSGASR